MQNQNWRFLSRVIVVAAVTVLFVSFSTFVAAQDNRTPEQPEAQAPYQAPSAASFVQQGTVITPTSSVERPEDAGVRAHTNYLLFAPAGRPMSSTSPDNTVAENPASIACVYKVGPSYAGCVPVNNGDHATGGWGAIALVDAYDDATAASDLAYFDRHFTLPVANFTKVYANESFGTLGGLTASCSGTPPAASTYGWDVEESLDIEWAHAMAPSAKIILVEACSSSLNDLFYAEYVAGIEVSADGGGDISNSWGGGEFAGEVSDDNFFYRYYYSHITYFASAGNSGWGAAYPSSSPWVVSAGGTTINRDVNGNFLSESCWSGSGGGVSAYEKWQSPPSILNGMGPWTNYQYELFGGAPYETPYRATPDMSFDADPASGVWVRDTDSGGSWYIVGGTDLASPALAGIVNASNNRLGQTPPGGGSYFAQENNLLYSQLYANTAYSANFYDVTTGSNGTGHNAGLGYDQCTGVGSPRGKLGK
jgi:kumamolisin